VAGVRRAETRAALAVICVFVVGVGAWNVAHYPPFLGYDAGDHISYATGLVPGGHLPHDTGEYYTPPGYYALAGSAVWIARKLGVNDYSSLRAGMALNILFVLGTVLLVAQIASELWPRRPRIALGAAAFVALLPVVVESEAMFHPETLSLFLTTLALWLCVRTFADPRYALGLGAALGAAQLVRAFALWTVAAVALALIAGRRWHSLLTVLVLAAAIPSAWYIHQAVSYGGQPTFPQPTTAQGRNAAGAPKPIYERRPLAFYVDSGIPKIVTRPFRQSFNNQVVPTTYAGLWGDYFGVWAWQAHYRKVAGARVIIPPPASARHRLEAQSLIGFLPTLLAIAGWLMLLVGEGRRRAKTLAVGLLPLLGLLGYLYFTVGYPTGDGNVIKTSYMLTTTAGWALGFGYLLDRLRRGPFLALAVLLTVCALVDVTFLVYG
jgi:hypothetical protein